MTHDVCIVIFYFHWKKDIWQLLASVPSRHFFLHLENMIDLFSITVLHYIVVLLQIENSTFCDLVIALCHIAIFIIFRLIAQPYFYHSPQTSTTTLKTNLLICFTYSEKNIVKLRNLPLQMKTVKMWLKLLKKQVDLELRCIMVNYLNGLSCSLKSFALILIIKKWNQPANCMPVFVFSCISDITHL